MNTNESRTHAHSVQYAMAALFVRETLEKLATLGAKKQAAALRDVQKHFKSYDLDRLDKLVVSYGIGVYKLDNGAHGFSYISEVGA